MRLSISIMIAISLLCVSCKEKQQEQVKIWDGNNVVLKHKEYPKSVIWFKESAKDMWIPYKGFCQAKEIKKIIKFAEQPEIAELKSDLRAKNKLSLIYYEGVPEEILRARNKHNLSPVKGEPVLLTAVEIYFDVNDGMFVGPKGRSQELGELLLSKEESGLARYRFAIPPYNEEQIDNIEKMNLQLREQQKEYENQQQLQDANEIHE
jgi:hypothetical protein